jgi:hypothetical protein
VAISGADTVGYIPGHGLLAAAKAGMETIVRYLACELGPLGVTAVGVLPGYIDTDSIKLMTGPFHDKLLAAEQLTHPLRTAATPDDASEAIALVCLPEARWLNGQIVQNDGGGLFAYMGRFGQAWAMVPDEQVMPDVTGAPMLGGSEAPPADARAADQVPRGTVPRLVVRWCGAVAVLDLEAGGRERASSSAPVTTAASSRSRRSAPSPNR